MILLAGVSFVSLLTIISQVLIWLLVTISSEPIHLTFVDTFGIFIIFFSIISQHFVRKNTPSSPISSITHLLDQFLPIYWWFTYMYLFTRRKNLAIKRWNHETVVATSIYNWEGLSMITFCLRDSVCRRDSKPVVQVFGFSLIWLNISWFFFMDNFNSQSS